MRATTVRFGADLWRDLEAEAARVGVSVAQYVRDAALIRVTWERLRAGSDDYETAARLVDEPFEPTPREPRPADVSARLREESRALRSEAEQAERRSQEVLARTERASGRSRRQD